MLFYLSSQGSLKRVLSKEEKNKIYCKFVLNNYVRFLKAIAVESLVEICLAINQPRVGLLVK